MQNCSKVIHAFGLLGEDAVYFQFDPPGYPHIHPKMTGHRCAFDDWHTQLQLQQRHLQQLLHLEAANLRSGLPVLTFVRFFLQEAPQIPLGLVHPQDYKPYRFLDPSVEVMVG
jgi:hypothetical protein